MRWRRSLLVISLAICPLLSTLAGSRPYAGSILGTVTDVEGESLGKVRVTLAGPAGTRRAQTDDAGRFRFDSLDPGSYELRAEGDGYASAIHDALHIRAGRATSVRVQLSAAMEETLIVATEPPAASPDPYPTRTLSRAEMEEIPAAADPFAEGSTLGSAAVLDAPISSASIASQGGSSQAAAASQGVVQGQPTVFPSAGSPSSVDVGSPFGAVGGLVNLVSAPAGPSRRADLQLSLVDRSWQRGGEAQTDLNGGADSELLLDSLGYGLDAGVGLFDDRLWVWGGHGAREVRHQVAGGQIQTLRLDHTAFKAHGQPSAQTSTVLAAQRGGKENVGEGAGLDRDRDATGIQLEPGRWMRLDVQQVVAPDLMLALRGATSDAALRLSPFEEGGNAILGPDGIWRGGHARIDNLQDTNTWEFESHHYHRTSEGDHDVRAGIRNHQANTSETERWGASDLLVLAGENFGTPFDLLRVRRGGNLRVARTFTSLWAQDSLTSLGNGNWTFNYGLRYDLQKGSDRGGTVASNPLFPELLPGIDYEGAQLETVWNDFSPRFGVAWSPDDGGRTIFRASYGSYASRMHEDHIGRTSPLATSELVLAFDDLDQDRRYDPSEPIRVVDRIGVDPFVPGSATHPNANDRSLRSERTEELRVGMSRHVGHATELRLDYSIQQTGRVLETRRFIRGADGSVRLARASDYVLQTLYTGLLPDGTPYSAPIYGLADGLSLTGGSLLNNGDRKQLHEALTFGFDRRLSQGFLVRGHVTLSDWRWEVGDGFTTYDDPTNDALGTGDDDGDLVVVPSGEGTFANSRWSFDVFGLYQVAAERPWGFDCALHLHGREGYPIPYSVTVTTDDGLRRVQATPDGASYRLEDIYTVDLRLQKDLDLGSLRATLSLDAHNLLDSGGVLEREAGLNSPLANAALDTLHPRVFQIGVRLALD
ncbi:MAG: carboxypeptidase regulatory-like domain-containing protein [Acidobacteriota bacterium]